MESLILAIIIHGLLACAYEIDHLPEHRISKRNADYAGGIDYVGIGYNLLFGNPDGSPTTAALDPGLRITYRVFDWTFDKGNDEPDQIYFTSSQTCADEKNYEFFHNEYSYADKFELEVSLSGSATFEFGSTQFSHSSYYEEASQDFGTNSYIYYEDNTYCFKGQARYLDELASSKKYPLSNSFVSFVNTLPYDYSEQDSAYMNFIDKFGTHVVTEVLLGTKEVDRYYWTTSEFTSYTSHQYTSSTSLSGDYLGYSGSISIDVDSVAESFNAETSEASHSETFTLGDEDLSLPYAYTLISMDEIFDAKYWQLYQDYVDEGILSADFYHKISDMKKNMYEALGDYIDYLNSKAAVEDPIITVPITWPLGTYGLPKSTSGCPEAKDFTFHSGERYHDNEDDDNGNSHSGDNHFVSGSLGNDMTQHFCMKTVQQETDYDTVWPSGRYCVFKASNGNCPDGMEDGEMYWDDEDDNNKNKFSGSLPAGSYGSNTRIKYCCKVDGFSENAIYLPTDSPFYLFPYDHNCQTVEGMTSEMEYIRWDNEDDDNKDSTSGYTPYKSGGSNWRIYYCYYYDAEAAAAALAEALENAWKGWPFFG